MSLKDGLLKDKLEALPDRSGVYMFKDGSGEIIYVGKAKSLRNRVRSYFTAGDDGRYQYQRLVAAIRDVEVLLTRDEVEALRTEAAMIRLHKPKYNVDLKDDKSFPFLKITREPFPRITLTRKKDNQDGDYYGPYTDVKPTKYLVRTLKGTLHIRNCNQPLSVDKIEAGRYKRCLNFHIGRCRAPCEGLLDEEQYRKGIQRFIRFLHGRHEEIITELKEEMLHAASNLDFERAAEIRDRLYSVSRFSERQERVFPNPVDRDAINLSREDGFAAFSVIKVRNGRIIGQSPFHMERTSGIDDASLLEAFIIRHYDLVDHFPRELLLPFETPDLDSLVGYLAQAAGRKVTILLPQRGEKNQLVRLALTNAEHLLAERRLMADKRDFIPRSLKALQEQLNLPSPPLLIEAFDISNLAGTDSIASMVAFKDGKPWKKGYRVFKIKSVEGVDDFASIGEAVFRRYNRLKTEITNGNEEESTSSDDENDNRLPDLVLIDGGKGQLNRAKSILNGLELTGLPVIGLAKRLEEIFIPGESEPIMLPRSSSALRLLQQVRNDAHRFAITRHRLLRGKRQVKSRLDDIPGIGSSRRQALLKAFGSIKRIAEADVTEIAAVKGMTKNLAENVKQKLLES